MMDSQRWGEFLTHILDDLSHTMARKNKDYTAGSGDPFYNFRISEEMGIDPLCGIFIRLLDKTQRVKSFISSGKLHVDNEGVEDALMDIMGYSCLMLGMLQEAEEEDDRALENEDNYYTEEEGPSEDLGEFDRESFTTTTGAFIEVPPGSLKRGTVPLQVAFDLYNQGRKDFENELLDNVDSPHDALCPERKETRLPEGQGGWDNPL